MTRQLRYSVEPRDICPEKAARRLGLTLDQFSNVLPRLLSRGFPAPDLDTGNYDLDEIDAWRASRHRRKAPTGPERHDHTIDLVNRRLRKLTEEGETRP